MGRRSARVAGVVAGLWLAAACALAAGARAQVSLPACGSSHWVAAWTADPSGALGPGSSDQTLRIVLTPHIGGGQVRVHLSNRFGQKPVSVNHASIGLRQSGAALIPGSAQQLTFGGQLGVVIPVGGEAISDPASISFGPFQDLAVSLYVMAPTGPATGHFTARERSYATARSAGDHSADAGASAFAAQTTSAEYVDAIDVLAPAAVGGIVAFGDSITDGYESSGTSGAEDQSGIDANQRFPDYLARRLLAQPGGPRLSVLNAGISGNRLLVDGQQSLAGMAGLARLDNDVLGVAGVTDAIVLEGINDIALLASANQMEAALKQVVDRLHARGIRVLLGTLTPAGTGLLNLGNLLPSIYIDSSANMVRVAVNAWIRSGSSGADGVLDFDGALRAASLPNELNLSLDSGDHVHPSANGYSRMADAVDLSSLRGAQCAAAAPPAATQLRVRARVGATGRLRVTGTLAGGGSACAGTLVTIRALHGGHAVFARRVRVGGRCTFAVTRRITVHGRVEIRASFAGTAALLASHARRVFVHAP